MVPLAALAAACGLCLTLLQEEKGFFEVLCLARRLLVWVTAAFRLCLRTCAESWLFVARCMVFPLVLCLGVSAGSRLLWVAAPWRLLLVASARRLLQDQGWLGCLAGRRFSLWVYMKEDCMTNTSSCWCSAGHAHVWAEGIMTAHKHVVGYPTPLGYVR